MIPPELQVYQGGRAPAPDAAPPLYTPWNDDEDPAHYLPGAELREAVNVAIALGQPLLLTGDPGSGKTQLAHSVAHDLGAGRALVFDAKTTSSAQDLFYRYDALGHFHAARREGGAGPRVRDHVQFQALGLAILLAMDPEVTGPLLPPGTKHDRPRRSVVLIDEVDKAPRDFPNDILREIETMSFRVREAAENEYPCPVFSAGREFRPIVILASNSERNLPDAFLRRCVFYHLAPPGKDELRRIVALRLGRPAGDPDERARIDEGAIAHFVEIRDELPLRKRPGTAELLAWVQTLRTLRLDVGTAGNDDAARHALARTYTVLAKTLDDLTLLRERLGVATA